MRKALFIINPRAGVDRVKALKKDLKEQLNPELFDYEIVYTEYAKHGTKLAKEGVEQGFDLVVAVGGDGSVNDVINGLYGSDVILGIIPKGSGNGLARSLNIPLKEADAIRLFNKWNIREIDLGSANGHIFASNAGVGFDTVVTHRFSTSNKRGFLTYIQVIVKSIWSYKVKEFDLTVDGEKSKSKSFMLTAANGEQLGYGFKVAPDARPDDGYFDFVNVRKFPTLMASLIAVRAFMGRIKDSKYISIQRAKEITISHPELDMLQIDGEAIACENPVHIQMMPKRLKVLTLP